MRLFRARIELLGQLQQVPDLDPDAKVVNNLTEGLYSEVAAMNEENFIVRMKREKMERFKDRTAWEQLSEEDRQVLSADVAVLPTELEFDDLRSRMFDLTALRMQHAVLTGHDAAFERHRKKVVELAMLLEEKTGIPAVAKQLAYLQALQDPAFCQGMDVPTLEDLRIRLRGLVQFLDKKERKVVYTDFKDEILVVRDDPVVPMPNIMSVQFKKKVRDYLRNHLDNIVIHRLRTNRPLTQKDLEALEDMLVQLGEDDRKTLLSGLLERSGTPSLPYFVRSLVGMDEVTAKQAFSNSLSNTRLTVSQIRFVETLIEQLASRGLIEPSALYEPPFTTIHAGGPEELFAGKDQVIDGIFQTLDKTRPTDSAASAG